MTTAIDSPERRARMTSSPRRSRKTRWLKNPVSGSRSASIRVRSNIRASSHATAPVFAIARTTSSCWTV